MKTAWMDETWTYNGGQLKPLYIYQMSGILGDGAIGWLGPCNVPQQALVDAEDLRAGHTIASDSMVHFLIELFDCHLFGMVCFQRLLAEMVGAWIEQKTGTLLIRSGDDLFLDEKKLNVSIATRSQNSCLIHFAVNAVSSGAPVPVVSLADIQVSPEAFGKSILMLIEKEVEGIRHATYKVFPR